MKKLLLILSSTFLASAAWSAEETSSFLGTIKTNCANATALAALEKSLENSTADQNTYPGSSDLYTCQGLTNNKIRHFYSKGNRPSYEFDWFNSILLSQGKDKCKEISALAETDATKNTKINELANDLQAKYKKSYQSHILKCESVAYVLNRAKVDWERPAHPKNEVKEFKQLNIKCSTSGLETLDYDSCVDFAESFENFEAVQNLGYQGQQLVYQEKMATEQAKVAEEQDAAKGALKATKVSMENQQDMYNQRAAVDGAKLAMLYSKYQEMPSNDSILAYCNGFQNHTGKIQETWTQDTCYKAVIGSDARFDVLQNQAMRDKMKAKLIQVAASAGQNLIVAGLMGKRAGDIDKALAKVDSFQPIDPFTVSEDEFLTTYCKQNPGAEKCLTGGLDRTIDGISDNVITFGEGATGTAYENPYNPTTPTSAIDSGSSSTDKSPTKVGSVLAAAAQDNSIESSGGAATVKAGGTGGSGPGGGAASGGSAGGAAGGGAAPGQGQGQADARVATKAPSYGGGSGGLSVLGGMGINKAKTAAKDEGNPFGKLFDKDGAKSNLVNLPGERGIASTKVGDKNGDLFKMISDRYSSVKSEKRLLEYELAK